MQRKSKSSLVDHRFPPFYACYLLKSIRTSQCKATYIGSTPNPPHRIRQHNGEKIGGALKTERSRPWVMQMIVHGFPSKLAALQFEWAWQHPHVSRHLRNEDGKSVFSAIKSRRYLYLKDRISIVRAMIALHPYNTWPLHVKLFTKEAAEIWWDGMAELVRINMPSGFTCVTELEGVDGKSGEVGTGRVGPIDITDSEFTSEHLKKTTNSDHVVCSVCRSEIHGRPLDPLTIAVCPSRGCTAVSHLMCLSEDFLRVQGSGTDIIPRGGRCGSCKTYVLWGDIIRGCYRRRGGVVPDSLSEDDDAEQEDAASAGSVGDAEGTDPSLFMKASQTQPAQRRRPTTSKRKKLLGATVIHSGAADSDNEEEEFFDLKAVSSSEEECALGPSDLGRRPRHGPSKHSTRFRASSSIKKRLHYPLAARPLHLDGAVRRADGVSSARDAIIPSGRRTISGPAGSSRKTPAGADSPGTERFAAGTDFPRQDMAEDPGDHLARRNAIETVLPTTQRPGHPINTSMEMLLSTQRKSGERIPTPFPSLPPLVDSHESDDDCPLSVGLDLSDRNLGKPTSQDSTSSKLARAISVISLSSPFGSPSPDAPERRPCQEGGNTPAPPRSQPRDIEIIVVSD